MTTSGESNGPWARKAEALYDDAYAKKYRDRDESLLEERSYQQSIAWLQQVCGRFHHRIDVLDLGCGTGRYFWGVENASSLVGFDASPAMLAQARHPIRADRITARELKLLQGDVATQTFEDGSFDLVYSIGVLAEHVPLDTSIVDRVWRWLKPDGRFAFTTVHPKSPDVPKTFARRLASVALPLAPGAAGRALHRRLMAGGMYGDERWIREVLGDAFAIESLEQFRTDVHLHERCVARKVTT
ncbi:MAG TPA: class I SAM-dependent methyltransferase [Vicinamibacterales bacterium]|nr:class I SAM-dependent methyltransferase [Vicinamibacterales bacterium]